MKRFTLFSKLLLIIWTLLFAQGFTQNNGVLSGKIVDSQNGEIIIGANVLVEGTTFGAATDLDGKYLIKNIPAGKYDIVVTYISYSMTIIKDVVINNNQTTILDLALKSEAIQVDEVMVIGEASNQYEAALLNQRRKSIQISDGISAEQIKRSTDNTTAETLRRIPGLTLLDNKYIYVRGVSERYNGALLNNSPLASSEPDKKDFAFDLIPS
ncbi:MAG: carboxypeptidase-like regulatory domain-containing protein, partial [Ignavibacteriaceae bacterium]